MTEPVFGGFQSAKQNWSPLPHQLIGAMPMIKSLAELKVILYVLRHTWGYQEFDEGKRISLDEFMNGRKRRDGSRIDSGVGMVKDSVMDGINRAVSQGFLLVEKAGDPGRQQFYYMPHMVEGDQSKSSTSPVEKFDQSSRKVRPRTEKETLEGKVEDSPSSDSVELQAEILKAVAEVTGCDAVLNQEALAELARDLHAAGYTAENVRYWYQHGWSSHWKSRGGRPSLKEVRQMIGQIRTQQEAQADGGEDPYFAALERHGVTPIDERIERDKTSEAKPYSGYWQTWWLASLGQLQIQLNKPTYAMYPGCLVLTDVIEIDGDILEFQAEAPNVYVRDWLNNYLVYNWQTTLLQMCHFGEHESCRRLPSGRVGQAVKITINTKGTA